VAPQLRVCEVSVKSGDGMETWTTYLQSVRTATALDRSPAI
jgi:hypothetical protein